MSRSVGTTIADSLQVALGYADRLLKDVNPKKFSRFAIVGNQTIQSNHAAFILGHLSLYAPRIVEQLGGATSSIAPPAAYETLFSKDATCQDDLHGAIYPQMSAVVNQFTMGYQAALGALRQASDDQFQQPNPGSGRIAELFPTLGSMHAFYCGGHIMMHLGQLSAWRRMQGLGPA